MAVEDQPPAKLHGGASASISSARGRGSIHGGSSSRGRGDSQTPSATVNTVLLLLAEVLASVPVMAAEQVGAKVHQGAQTLHHSSRRPDHHTIQGPQRPELVSGSVSHSEGRRVLFQLFPAGPPDQAEPSASQALSR